MTPPPAHVSALLDALAPASAASVPDIASRLGAGIAHARAAHPGLQVDEARFSAHVGTHLRATRDLAADLDALHWADLWLAFACLGGDAAAIAAFERLYMRDLPAALAQVRESRDTIGEIGQLLRTKLFVSDEGEAPKIATYSGRGPLGGWVRVVAVRISHALRRKVKPTTADDSKEALLAMPGGDMELEHLRTRFAPEFKAAFQEALGALSPDDRNVIRMHVVDGLSAEQIAQLRDVHRTTTTRWLAQIKEGLFERTKALLVERLNLSPSEFRSLGVLLQSQLDASIARLLDKD